MNINPGQFPTYKTLSPVLRTKTTCKAGEIVRSVKGVKSIKNDLIVK
jgi:osmotically-inducible protein OsmY